MVLGWWGWCLCGVSFKLRFELELGRNIGSQSNYFKQIQIVVNNHNVCLKFFLFAAMGLNTKN